jgi:hypothetical protein
MIRRLLHRPRALVEATPTKSKESTFITLQEKMMGEKPKVSFAAQMAVYIADPMARAAVDFLAEQVAGPGFYTTAEDEKAKELIDDFCAHVNLDEMLLQTAREIVGLGNSFWNRAAKSVKIIPILSIDKILRTPRGVVKGYVQTPAYGGKTLRPDRVIHFRWSPINNEAFGSGLLRTVVESLRLSDGETRLCFAEMKARMQKAMIEQFEKFSAPNELWTFKGLTSAELKTFARRLKNLPAKGARLAYNDEAEIKQATMQLGRGWEAYVETILNEFLLGLQTPIPRLFTTPGFTEASARAALEAAERKVMAIQRFMKRIVEREVFYPILRDAGYNPLEARVRLNWGQPEVPELKVEDMLRAVELGVVRREEVRNMLIKAGWELTELEKNKTHSHELS